MQDTNIVNLYKLPPCKLVQTSLPNVPALGVYAGDFNCQHTGWAYRSSNIDSYSLVEWASGTDATLLYNPKEPSTFYSACWNSTSNPDLAFAKCCSNEPHPLRLTMDRFPRSHNRTLLITIQSLVQPLHGKDIKRWNFQKANWTSLSRYLEKVDAGLPLPSSTNLNGAYDLYCKMMLAVAKKYILTVYTKSMSPAGIMSIKIFSAPTKTHKLKKGTLQRMIFCVGSMRKEGKDGWRWWNQLISHTPVSGYGKPLTI